MKLEEFQRQQFAAMRGRVKDIEQQISTLRVHTERAEVAGAMPRFDTTASLPATTAAEGSMAFVRDAGGGAPAAFIYDGTTWRRLNWT